MYVNYVSAIRFTFMNKSFVISNVYQKPSRKLSCQNLAELSNSLLLAKSKLENFLKSKTSAHVSNRGGKSLCHILP